MSSPSCVYSPNSSNTTWPAAVQNLTLLPCWYEIILLPVMFLSCPVLPLLYLELLLYRSFLSCSGESFLNIFFPYLLFIRPSWLNEAICPADSGGGQSDLDRYVNKQAVCFEPHVTFKLLQLVHIVVRVACSWKKQASLKQLFLV